MHNADTDTQELAASMPELITTSEVAKLLGISRQAVVQRVRTGSLRPAYKSPAQTGTYLFSTPDVACLALELAR